MIKYWVRTGAVALVVILSALIASTAHANGGAELANARAHLLGQGTRNWIKERIVVSMGGDKKCTSGETYSFHSNGSVGIAMCSNHVLRQRNVPWTLSAAPPLDVNLVFDGRSYQLSFAGTAHAPQMRWRQLGQVKLDPTTDIYLGLSKD